jgi:hypothetical protein
VPRTQLQIASITKTLSGAYYIVLPDEAWRQARAGKIRIFKINSIGATPEYGSGTIRHRAEV